MKHGFLHIALLSMLCGSTSAELVRQPNTTLSFPATLPSATGYTAENAFGGLTFNSPVGIATPPNVTERLFVVERTGAVQMVNVQNNTKSVFFDITAILATLPTPRPVLNLSSECGLLSLAFHPNYNENGYLYIFHSVTINSSSQRHQRVARLQAQGTPGNYNVATSVIPASYTPIITQRDVDSHHNGSDMHFGPDGYLYISLGDGGVADDGQDNARKIAQDFFGAILRIDVDLRPGNLLPNPHTQSGSTTHPSAVHEGTYRVPADNPFTNLPVDGNGNSTYAGFTFPNNKVRTEMWAVGFRNPWRMSFDPPTGRLFVADVGQQTREEVNLVTKGFNGGWSWREGSQPHTPPSEPLTPPQGLVLNEPIYDYRRGTGDFQGGCVTGGLVYRGSSLSELHGQYIFGDYNQGRVWALREENGTWIPTKLLTLSGSNLSAFGADPRNGDVLMCEFGTGIVKRLVRNFGGPTPAATLSGTGAFSDLETLTPNAGIVPFGVNLPLWSDHAIKTRWFSIPNLNGKMQFSKDGLWTFPNGQVWIKHFEIETTRGDPASKRRLETRFLVKNSGGVYGLTYKWRPDGSDADLVGEGGLDEVLTINVGGTQTSQVWRYPGRSECTSCHTAEGGHVLGFTTRQLNRLQTYGVEQHNQLTALANAGYFQNSLDEAQPLPAHPRLDDDSISREARVRAYFAVNCAQCHVPSGPGQGNWDARASTPTDLAQIINGGLVNNGGNAANRFVVPGDAAKSVAYHRMIGTQGFSRMPPLGTNVVDPTATQLLHDWITLDLPQRRSWAEWQEHYFGSTSAVEAGLQADPDGDSLPNAVEFLNNSSPAAASPPLTILQNVSDGVFRLTFTQPANRSALVETSTDLVNWTVWEVAGNVPFFPAGPTQRVLEGPFDATARHFRIHLTEP